MKFKDLLNNELNEMAAVNNAEAVIKLIKAGKYEDAVKEMFKEKQLKVVPGNISSGITKEEKAKFSEALKAVNPSAQRGPGAKAADKRVEVAATEKKTSVQDQSVIKKKLMNTLAKAAQAVQSDSKLSNEEKELNLEALEVLKDALLYTINFKAGILSPKALEISASKRQEKIADEFLKKNAPEVLAKAKEMAQEHKEDIAEYIEARKAYSEKMKKDEDRDTTPAKDIDAVFKSGLLRRVSKVKPDDDEFDKKLGTDDETIRKEVKAEEKAALEKANLELDRKMKSVSREKQAQDALAEVKRLEARYEEAKKKGRTGKILKDLEEKIEAAKDVAKEAKTAFIKDRWEKMKASK
jgi:hypothetical protein